MAADEEEHAAKTEAVSLERPSDDAKRRRCVDLFLQHCPGAVVGLAQQPDELAGQVGLAEVWLGELDDDLDSGFGLLLTHFDVEPQQRQRHRLKAGHLPHVSLGAKGFGFSVAKDARWAGQGSASEDLGQAVNCDAWEFECLRDCSTA